MGEYILTIDEGTTSARAIVLNHEGECISIADKEFNQYYPKSGWLEHDANEIWTTTIEVIKKALQSGNISDSEIKAIGITNQRETTVVWDKNTGKPLYNAIVWADRRTAEYCADLKSKGFESMVKEKTGLLLDPYFSGTKVRWILDNVEGAQAKAENGELYFSNIDGWIIWNLTNGKIHVTDYSNASRTLLFNINELKWDDELLKMLNIPTSMLPEVKPSSGYFATATNIFSKVIPITGVAGDQQAATFGQCCFKKGMSKITFGTAGVLTLNIGNKPKISKNGLLTTIGWGLDGKVDYLFEGTVYNAGSSIQWLRDEMGFIEESSDSEHFAEKVHTSEELYVVPAFTGFAAPYWDPYARGVIVGITRGTNKNNIVRATSESLGYQTRDLIDALNEDMGEKVQVLKVDGGACRNNLITQFTSDIIGIPVERPENVETTAAGAAYLAGLAVGYWESEEDIACHRKIEKVFKPIIDENERSKLYKGWKRAVNAALVWSKDR
ncbi:glycerol kinase GlpK [Clostridium scatologenes]|uniref:Glycerol kinase n=1 Tax=Clostridium scatologenes TaxID=1548 RepID=A0A0E3GQ51_CLOSL|nr:glycerol kinase GlpK [Clostridium scatologenes]AKA67961.1 glycerol kinase [Clostridium scatologenes]